MNHGGLAYIDENEIILPDSLLRPLSIYEDSRVFGLYYTPPLDFRLPGYSNVRKRPEYHHDFVLTPVPFHLWPISGHLTIRLKHEKQTLCKVSSILKENNVSILTTECTRSGHRYATWVITVYCESLIKQVESLTFNKENSYYQQTYAHLLRSIKAIKKKCSDVLFEDHLDPHLRNSVRWNPLYRLAYTYEIGRKRKRKSKGNELLNEPFHIKFSGGKLRTEDSSLSQTLMRLESRNNMDFPTCAFAELDYEESTVRFVLIPKKKLKNFCEIRLDYQSFSDNKAISTKGFIELIIRNSLRNLNLWRATQRVQQFDKGGEKGTIHFFAEGSYRADYSKEKNCLSLRKRLENVKAHLTKVGLENVKLKTPRVLTLEPNQLKQSLEIETRTHAVPGSTVRNFANDVFLSYSARDIKEAEEIHDILKSNNLECFMAENSIRPGFRWEDEIRSALLDTRSLWVLVTRNSIKSDWVLREISAAWALGRNILPIYLKGVSRRNLPPYLRDWQALPFNGISKHVQSLL